MKVLNWLDEHLEETLLIGLLAMMTLIMGVQIVCRYAFNASLTWSEELTRYLFIWSGFLSISYCIKKWISIKIDQIMNMLPKSGYIICQLLLNSILFLLFFYLSMHAVTYLQGSIASGQRSPALGLPMYVVQSAPLVGFALASIRAFQQIILEVHNLKTLHTSSSAEKGEE